MATAQATGWLRSEAALEGKGKEKKGEVKEDKERNSEGVGHCSGGMKNTLKDECCRKGKERT